MKPPPGRLATLQCHSWTQSSTPGWGLVLKASCRQDTAPCGQSEHTGQSGEAGGAERSELPGMPVPQGAGWSQLDGAPEHASHVHTPLHLTHTHAHTHAYSYTRTPRCTHIHIYAHARTHAHRHTQAHMHTYAHTGACTRVCTCPRTHICTHVCAHTQTQAHTLLYILFTFPFPMAPGTQASQCPLLETLSPVTPILAPPCALAAISHVPGTVLTLPQWTRRMTCFPCPGLLVAQGRTMAPR